MADASVTGLAAWVVNASSAFGTNRTRSQRLAMSVHWGRAEVARKRRHFRFLPTAVIPFVATGLTRRRWPIAFRGMVRPRALAVLRLNTNS